MARRGFNGQTEEISSGRFGEYFSGGDNECLNVHEFLSIDHARQVIEHWRQDYNEHRPHGALGHLTPSEYARSGRKQTFEAAEL
jgi:putative transposase